MNNIHEKDWAEDSWSGHTGMNSFSDYCTVGDDADKALKDQPKAAKDQNDTSEQKEEGP